MTSAEIVAGVVAILAALGGFLKLTGEVAKLRSEAAAAKVQADAAAEATRETADAAATKAEMDVARQMIDALAADNSRLRKQLQEVEDYWKRRVNELEAEVSRLRQIMRECGVDPDTTPAYQVRKNATESKPARAGDG